ncbi:MAG: ATP-binding domain-containing protein, partial [Gammaproteobacteria bacterium]|nr:ATP-binding domain-containing protein [Gammaproteobacteria bacterium]
LVVAEDKFKERLAEAKAVADELLRKERNLLFNCDKDIFNQLAALLESLDQESDEDDDERFDEDEQEDASTPSHNAIHMAVNAYLAALKTLARTKYLKRSMSKNSRASVIVDFLGDRLPSEEILLEIGRNISIQNGLRRFVGSHRRFIREAASSYSQFRRKKEITEAYYAELPMNRTHLSDTELDGLVLLILKNARLLLKQSFVSRALKESRFSYLASIAELFRNQIMVDEATDFSMLELACMANLTSIECESFFACGDFNQRITSNGVSNESQLKWAVRSFEYRIVQTVYRQSRKLNEFAESLLRLQGGDLRTLGKVQEESTHDGVSPVLKEYAAEEECAAWIADRIKEVEKTVKQLPTIAVLVNSEAQVRPMAKNLTALLEDINLMAVACEEGKALGEGTDVRVFDIQHIKGLEFEAVFFAGVDQLATEKPDLFDRFLYVGTTRAATYLGLVCVDGWPKRLESLRSLCESDWCV